MSERVALVTGGTSGIGLACADRLATMDYRVFAGSRTAQTVTGAEWLPIDVNDDTSVGQAIEVIMTRAGRIDVIVCAAGYALAGPVEQTTIEEARAQLETNFFGVVRTVRAVLPGMRARRSGLIVAIGSFAGRLGLPFQPYYSAAKAALEAWTEALRVEVCPHGIRVSLLHLGNFRTPFTDHRIVACCADTAPYGRAFRSALAVAARDERGAVGPQAVACVLQRIVRARNPPPSILAGPIAERVLWRLKPLLPDALYGRIIRRHFDLP